MEVQIAACEVNVSVSRLSRACCTLMVASSSPRTLELTAKAHVERHFRVVVVESQVEIFTHAVLNLVCTYSHFFLCHRLRSPHEAANERRTMKP